jgi:hypothetical protein
MGESQVSIARWVAMGAAGVHGTTDEPLNNCFPSRRLIVSYVDGGTLAESYHRSLPYVYWMNLVLGDPMLAPYAVRPIVTLDGVADGDTVADARMVHVSATDPEGLGVDSLALFLDGTEVARADGDALDLCLDVPGGFTGQLLAVAQKRDDGTARGLHRPKGWLAIQVNGADGFTTCGPHDAGPSIDAMVTPRPDAGPSGADAGTGPGDSSGCACAVHRTSAASATGLAFAGFFTALAFVRLRRGARSPS